MTTKERPILFSGEMIRAILARRKTQTRRVLKRDKLYNGFAFDDPRIARACPYGQPGDRLWVRETYGLTDEEYLVGRRNIVHPASNHEDGYAAAIYKADGEWTRLNGTGSGAFKWRPSIFMPRWASRITLEITSVRVERVQDISENDAIAEGFRSHCDGDGGPDWMATENFAYGWDDINAQRGYSFESNPWVWAIEFKLLEGRD